MISLVDDDGRQVYGWPKSAPGSWGPAGLDDASARADAPVHMSVDVFHDVYRRRARAAAHAGDHRPRRGRVLRGISAQLQMSVVDRRRPSPISTRRRFAMDEAADPRTAVARLSRFPHLVLAGRDCAREFALYEQMLAGLSPFPPVGVVRPAALGHRTRARCLLRICRVTSRLRSTSSSSAILRIRPRLLCALGRVGDGRRPAQSDRHAGRSDAARRQVRRLFDQHFRAIARSRLSRRSASRSQPYETAREGDVVTLRPSFPFWMDVDLFYGAGDSSARARRTCTTANGSRRRRGTGAAVHAWARRKGAAPQTAARPRRLLHRAGRGALRHRSDAFPRSDVAGLSAAGDAPCSNNSSIGAGTMFEGGHAPPKLRLELASSYVYLTTTIVGDAYGEMWSSTENIGWWAEREVAFAIPVRWISEGRLVGLAMIEPLCSPTSRARRPTARSRGGTPSRRYREPARCLASPGAPRAAAGGRGWQQNPPLQPGFGLQAKTADALEIDQAAPLPDASRSENWRGVAARWGRHLVEDLQRKSRAWREQPRRTGGPGAGPRNPGARRAAQPAAAQQYRDAAEFDCLATRRGAHAAPRDARARDPRDRPAAAVSRCTGWSAIRSSKPWG